MTNNLFSFATGELSQDAFICWCINWYNDSSKPVLNAMAKRILYKLTNIEDIESVEIHKQFSENVDVDEKKISVKIDVLLIINQNTAAIIEDKVYTSEHSDQINRYAVGLKKIYQNKKQPLNKIITVFWKTGFHYDMDKVTIADVVISAQDVKDILKDYVKESEIIRDYYSYLEELMQWYEIHKKYWLPVSDENNSLNISEHEIAQYTFMRDVFPEELWNKTLGKQYEKYQIYSGSSYGRPWTQTLIASENYSDGDLYEIFWRIDTDKKGPYFSLRLYEKYEKDKKDMHIKLYKVLSTLMDDIVENMPNTKQLGFGNCVKRGRGGYKEAAFFHYNLDFSNWDRDKNIVVKTLRSLNAKFIERFEKEIKPNF